MRGRDADIWKASMEEEMKSHYDCGTFKLVSRSECKVKPIPLQWVYKVKPDEFGNPDRAKSRLVARGDRCAEGVHYTETFAPVVHFTSARTFLSTCCQNGWEIHQMDVNTAFVNSDLDRDNVFFNLPDGYKVFDDDGKDISDGYLLHAKRALYGLPQSPRLWNARLTEWLLAQGFVQCKKDSCVFKYDKNGSVIRLIVYVDDLAFAGNDPELITSFKKQLSDEKTGFSMKDLGTLRYFLGMHVEQDLKAGTLKLHQRQYVEDMIKRYSKWTDGMKPKSTPADPEVTLSKADCPHPEEDPDSKYEWRPHYRSVVGSLLYAQCGSRADISAAVSKLSQFLENPGPKHWEAALHCLAYLKGTPDLGVQYTRTYDQTWANRLTMFVDATWADCLDTRRSTTGFVGMLNGGPVCWKSQKQPIVAQSSCEAEFIAACKGANEVCFLRDLLGEWGYEQGVTRMYEDNTAAKQLAHNPGALRDRSKHFELRWFKLQELVKGAIVTLKYIGTKEQVADALTKNLSKTLFLRLRDFLMGITRFDHSRYD